FERPEVFAIVQLGALISVIWLYHSVPNWPDYFYRLRSVFASHPLNFELYWMSVFVFFTVVLLIPVGLIGTNLPLLFGILRGKNIALSRTVGRLYAINCFGAAVGAAFGGYWVFHFFNGAQAYKI